MRGVADSPLDRAWSRVSVRQHARTLVIVLAAGLLAVFTPGASAPAFASKTISTRYLLGHLASAGEHSAGYDRGKFALWADADGDGCDTREEVLIAEARVRPRVLAGCRLTGGRWFSTYDAMVTTHPSGFDIDHLVPLNEAWQSGAYRWSAATRKAYANDLGYPASLLAVSARTNRSKSDRDPREWMPPRTSYSCHYVADWVAVKWRWHLSVNASERAFLDQRLRACGWPRVATPSRPRIATAGTAGATGSASGTRVDAAVQPGAFCAEHWSYGHTSTGTLMRCTTTATDARFRWRSA
ncbi:MAG: HNH endonuclease family protein [Actinomycetes bacterium]